MAQKISKPLAGTGIKVRYSASKKCWQVWTFFHGSLEWKWINCSARVAAWYYQQGAENYTPPSTTVPFTEVLHRQRRMKESEFSNVQSIS